MPLTCEIHPGDIGAFGAAAEGRTPGIPPPHPRSETGPLTRLRGISALGYAAGCSTSAASAASTSSKIRLRPLGAKVRSKKPPTPVAPCQVVTTATLLRPVPAGVTVQVVTIEELRSVSTSRPADGSVTSNRQSLTRLLVACSLQCTTVPAPWPPSLTSYSLHCPGSTRPRVPR